MRFSVGLPLAVALGGIAFAGTIPTLNYSDGGTNNSTGYVTGNVSVGAPNGGIQDSGNVLIKTGVAARNPTTTDDSTQGYSQGSIWINTASGALWTAASVTPSAATWYQATPTTYHPYVSQGWTLGNVATNTTSYTVLGSANGANLNTQAMFSGPSATISNLYIYTAAQPGIGQTYIITVYVGTPAAQVSTALTCTISGATNTCNDVTHSAAITEGQAWTVQIVTSAGAVATSQSSIGVRFTY